MTWKPALAAVLAVVSIGVGAGQRQSELRYEARHPADAGARNFLAYSETPLRDGLCVAGATVDEGGMDQRPVARKVSGDTIAWQRELPFPEYFDEGRATHCVEHDDHLHVLYQLDTHPAQSLSQTLVRVVRLESLNGQLGRALDVKVPGITGAYSAWVGQDGVVALRQGRLRVSGHYFLMHDADREYKQFNVEIPLAD